MPHPLPERDSPALAQWRALHRQQTELCLRLAPGRDAYLKRLESSVYDGYRFPWRVAEAPAIIAADVLAQDLEAMRQLVSPYLTNEFRARYQDHIPESFRRPDDSGWFPLFLATDFQRILNQETGTWEYGVPEIQSFPGNLFLKPAMIASLDRAVVPDAEQQGFLAPGVNDHDAYIRLIADHVLAGHAPTDTVILEIDPERQKTFVDLLLTSRHLGVGIVNLRDVQVDQVTGELLYRRVIHWSAKGPKLSEAKPRVASRVLCRALPDEWEAAESKGDLPRSLRSALLQDTLTKGTVSWAVHPQDFFVLSKSSLVGNPHHAHPLIPVNDQIWERLGSEGWSPRDGIIKPLGAAGGRGLVGFSHGPVGAEDLLRIIAETSSASGESDFVWQPKYRADLFDLNPARGGADASNVPPVFHELRIMWACRRQDSGSGSRVELIPLTGLTRWSQQGIPANAGHQHSVFTGTQGVLTSKA